MLTLIIHEDHWLCPIVCDVRHVSATTQYTERTSPNGTPLMSSSTMLDIVHDDGERETYRLWPETQYIVLSPSEVR